MSLAVAWMLLFGPATEAATYVLIAVPSAYLLIAGWSEGFSIGVASCQYAELSRVRQRAYSQFVVPNQKECLPDPRDPTLLDSLLFRSALFVVEAAAA